MSEIDELRARVETLETQVARLAEDSTDTRTLAGMADRDAGELRTKLAAQQSSLNALRETQADHTKALRGLADAVGTLVVGQARLEQQVAGLTGKVDGLDGKVDEILDLLRGRDGDE